MGVVAINLVEFGSLLFRVTKNFQKIYEDENVEEIVERLLEPKHKGKAE